jgi:hypothetical protein
MSHPKEPTSVSRREFLRRAGIAGIALPSLAAILASCKDSTSPSSGPKATTGEGGIALASPDNPVELPLYEDVPAIADGLPAVAGPLKVYNWNDYIY